MTLQRLIRSWHASIDLHSLRPGAASADLKAFEEAAGWRLPAEWRELYSFANGAELLRGNIYFAPLLGDDRCLLEKSAFLRRHGWPVPDELCVAGGDGEGNQLGLWLPAKTDETAPVVELGQRCTSHCLTIVGSSLSAFLLHRTVYFLLCYGSDPPPTAAFDALDVPQALRSLETLSDSWDAVAHWADPARPAGIDLNADEVNEVLVPAARAPHVR